MKRENVNGIIRVFTLKHSFLMSVVIICMIISIQGCITSEFNSDPEERTLENPLVLRISSERTTYQVEENLTIPITVEIENIDDFSYTIHEPNFRQSTLNLNVTNSEGTDVLDFNGWVDSPPNEITIDPKSSIKREFEIGGWGWIPPYFNQTGEYTFQVNYHNIGSMNQERLFDLYSNLLIIKVADL